MSASSEQLNHPLEHSIEIEDLHLLHHQQHGEPSDGDHVVLWAVIILSFGDILRNVEEDQKFVN